MVTQDLSETRELLAFIDAATSPFHACAEMASRLEAAQFSQLHEDSLWSEEPGRFYVMRGGCITAWIVAPDMAPEAGFRIIGAHTDSPNLHIKPKPDTGTAGVRQLGVEIYGGVLLNSWLDRDLGLSGRVMVRGVQGSEARLFHVNRPLLRVPQLAIHLDRDISSKGLLLNKQKHMSPVWALGTSDEDGLRRFVAAELKVDAKDVLSWDLMCHDTNPSTIFGREEEFISAPRLDNLASCFSGLRALLAAAENGPSTTIPMISFFDHEEVGSQSRSGAGGPILSDLIERSVMSRGGAREDYHRAIAGSLCVSADMAHATHPNYTERHEPDHFLDINAGPVIKINSNQRYATDAETEAMFQRLCEDTDTPFQKWVSRTDMGCGSTIGPISSSATGIRTVDVGNPMLSMHSIREMAGSHDPAHMLRVMTAFLG